MQSHSVAVSPASERISALAPWLVVALSGLAVLWFLYSYQYLEDDAYIHLEFARSVAEGRGFAFDGLVANGDTAPLWVLWLVAIHSIGLDWPETAKLACILGAVVAVLALWRIAADLTPPQAGRQRVALAVTALTVLNPFAVHWLFSGMESLTALGLSVWAIWAVFVAAPSRLGLATAAVLLGVGPLLRPELLLLAGLAGPVLLWRTWKHSCGAMPAVRVLAVIALALVVVLPVITWCTYALHTFGSIIPNTNAAKRGVSLGQVGERLVLVYAVGFPVALALLPVLALRASRPAVVPPGVWVLLLWPLLCIGFYLADHTLVQTRYCLLSMPCVTTATLWWLAVSGRESLWRGAIAATVLISGLLILLTVVPHVANKKAGVQAFTAMSAYVHEKVPAEEPVAVYAIGLFAFKSRHPIVDLGGITQPGAVSYATGQAGMLLWAKRNHARYFVSSSPPEPGAVSVFATRVPFLGWTLDTAQYRTLDPLVLYRLP